MKRRFYYICILAASMILFGCEEDRAVAMRVRQVADIIDETNGTDLGDRHIGIYVSSSESSVLAGIGNVEYYNGGEPYLSPVPTGSSIWLQSEYGHVNFDAYAPYQSSMSKSTPVYNIINWNKQQDAMALDLLVADKVLNRSVSDSEVRFMFRHVCSKIRLQFDVGAQSGLTSADLIDMKVLLTNMNQPIAYYLIEHEVTYPSSLNNEKIQLAIDNSQQTAWAILPPEQEGTFQGVNRQVEISLQNGNVYCWSIPNEHIFAGGTCTTWNLKFTTSEEVIIQDCSIQDWHNTEMEDIQLGFDD